MSDEYGNNGSNGDQVVGRGHITHGQVEDAVSDKIDVVLRESKRQLAGGCLQEIATKDQTATIPKKETIFYIDTDAMREAGGATQAKNIEDQKNLMLEGRRNANKAFEQALSMVDQATADQAIKVLNYAKEDIYYRNFNNYHQHADHSERGIASQSEMELSWVKLALAEQVANGSFKREIDAKVARGMPVVCEDNSLVR